MPPGMALALPVRSRTSSTSRSYSQLRPFAAVISTLRYSSSLTFVFVSYSLFAADCRPQIRGIFRGREDTLRLRCHGLMHRVPCWCSYGKSRVSNRGTKRGRLRRHACLALLRKTDLMYGSERWYNIQAGDCQWFLNATVKAIRIVRLTTVSGRCLYRLGPCLHESSADTDTSFVSQPDAGRLPRSPWVSSSHLHDSTAKHLTSSWSSNASVINRV